MLLRSLLDSRFRTFATPRLITWIYRGCLLVVALMTAWWVLVALIVMSWRNGWFWGLLLLILAPIIGVILLLCVRVAAELVVIRFRAAEPAPSSLASAEPLVSRAAEAARSVIRTLRQGGNVSEPPAEGAAEGLDPAPASRPVIERSEHSAEGLGAGLEQEWGEEFAGGHDRPSRLWVVGLAGAAVLLVLVALTVVVGSSGGGDDDQGRAAAPVRTVTVSASATPSSSAPGTASAAPVPTASTSTPATSLAPAWHGTVTVNGPSVERDFDVTPPRQDIPNADVRGDWLRPLLVGLSGTQLAVTSGLPDAAACRDAVASTGDSKTERLNVGDVVCLVTSGDHVARLITRRAEQTSTAPNMTFDAVVW